MDEQPVADRETAPSQHGVAAAPRSRWRLVSVAAFVVVAAISVMVWCWFAVTANDRALTDMFGGPDGRATVAGPAAVEVYQVEVPSQKGREPKDWSVIAGPVKLDKAATQRLSAALTNPKSYNWRRPLTCAPSNGPRLRAKFAREPNEVWADVDLPSNYMWVYSADFESVGFGTLMHEMPAARDIAAEAFPARKQEPQN